MRISPSDESAPLAERLLRGKLLRRPSGRRFFLWDTRSTAVAGLEARGWPCRGASCVTGRGLTTFLVLKLFGLRQDLFDVARNLDLTPLGAQHALLVDQEGRAVDPHVLFAVHRLLDPRAVGLDRLTLFVGG